MQFFKCACENEDNKCLFQRLQNFMCHLSCQTQLVLGPFFFFLFTSLLMWLMECTYIIRQVSMFGVNLKVNQLVVAKGGG